MRVSPLLLAGPLRRSAARWVPALWAGVLILSACATAPSVRQVSPAEAARMVEEGTMVLDVRTRSEYRAGHLETAVLIPVQRLADRLSELPPEKDTEILVHCRSGGRSAQAVEILRAKGYLHIYDLKGGIRAWEAEGLPVVRE